MNKRRLEIMENGRKSFIWIDDIGDGNVDRNNLPAITKNEINRLNSIDWDKVKDAAEKLRNQQNKRA